MTHSDPILSHLLFLPLWVVCPFPLPCYPHCSLESNAMKCKDEPRKLCWIRFILDSGNLLFKLIINQYPLELLSSTLQSDLAVLKRLSMEDVHTRYTHNAPPLLYSTACSAPHSYSSWIVEHAGCPIHSRTNKNLPCALLKSSERCSGGLPAGAPCPTCASLATSLTSQEPSSH